MHGILMHVLCSIKTMQDASSFIFVLSAVYQLRAAVPPPHLVMGNRSKDKHGCCHLLADSSGYTV